MLGLNITNESPESFDAYQANLDMADEQGVIGTLDKYNLDALVMPTFASFHLPAIAGLPVVTVPLGFYPSDTPVVWNLKGESITVAPHIPFGIAFVGRRWSEETLIALAYAFEQRTLAHRKMKPYVAPTFELGDRALDTAEVGSQFEPLTSPQASTAIEAMRTIVRRFMNSLLSAQGLTWAVLGMFETTE